MGLGAEETYVGREACAKNNAYDPAPFVLQWIMQDAHLMLSL